MMDHVKIISDFGPRVLRIRSKGQIRTKGQIRSLPDERTSLQYDRISSTSASWESNDEIWFDPKFSAALIR